MNKFALSILLTLCSTCLLAQTMMKAEQFGEEDGFRQSRVATMIQDRDGLLWMASWDGLICYDGYQFRYFKAYPGDDCPLETNRIDDVAQVDDNTLICRSNHKLYLFHKNSRKFEPAGGQYTSMPAHPNKHTQIRNKVRALKMLESIDIHMMFEDNQGGVWVSTDEAFYHIREVREPLTSQKYTAGNQEIIRALYRDKRGRIWIGDKFGRVRIRDINGVQTSFLSADGQLMGRETAFGHDVYCIFEDSRGWMWLGTKPDGLFRLIPDGTGFSITSYRHSEADRRSISNDGIYCIRETADGRLWIGTFGGGMDIAEVKADGTVLFTTPADYGTPRYPENAGEVRCLQLQTDGTLLMGTSDGLYATRTAANLRQMNFYASVRNPKDEHSLNSNRVMDIMRHSGGGIYVATYGGGVGQLEQGTRLPAADLKFENFTSKDVLASDNCLSLIEDKQGNIWIVSVGSLTCYDIRQKTFSNYPHSVFGNAFLFTEAHPLCLDDGTLLLGTTQGLLEMNPKSIEKSRFVPRIIFRCDSVLKLSPDERSLQVEFAALDYNQNTRIAYAYMLEGIDKDWNYTYENTANYANIPAGVYRLRVRSTNGDGVWTDNERSITIRRSARFNELPIAWMLYGGLILLACYIVYIVVRHIRNLRGAIEELRTSSNDKIERLGSTIRILLTNSKDEQKGSDDHQERSLPERITAYMDEHYNDSSFSVDAMAKELAVSRSVLYQQVKKHFGTTPNAYLQDLRIKQAMRLIMQEGANVSEVAYKCGFSDPKYFSRCFKKATGYSPSDYQKHDPNGQKSLEEQPLPTEETDLAEEKM